MGWRYLGKRSSRFHFMNTELIDKAVEHLNEAEQGIKKAIAGCRRDDDQSLRIALYSVGNAKHWIERHEHRLLNAAARERFREGKK